MFCTSSNVGLSYRWIKGVGPGPQEWENAQGLDSPFCVTHFSIISANQGKTNNGVELLSCLPSVLPTCYSTGFHLQGHLFRNKCCEEIHQWGSTSQISRGWCWRWPCTSLLTLSCSNTHFVLGWTSSSGVWYSRGHPKKFLPAHKLSHNSKWTEHWASAPSALGAEEELRKCLWSFIFSLLLHQAKQFRQNNFSSCSRANSVLTFSALVHLGAETLPSKQNPTILWWL